MDSNTHNTILSIKASFNNEFRRFTFPTSGTFVDLTKTLGQIYGLQDGSFNIQYQDDESDWIVISSDPELKTAFDFQKSAPVFKILVVSKENDTRSVANSSLEKPWKQWKKEAKERRLTGEKKKEWKRNLKLKKKQWKSQHLNLEWNDSSTVPELHEIAETQKGLQTKKDEIEVKTLELKQKKKDLSDNLDSLQKEFEDHKEEFHRRKKEFDIQKSNYLERRKKIQEEVKEIKEKFNQLHEQKKNIQDEQKELLKKRRNHYHSKRDPSIGKSLPQKSESVIEPKFEVEASTPTPQTPEVTQNTTPQ